MNVEIGAEAALFPEKEYMNGIAVAAHTQKVFMLTDRHTDRETLLLGGGGWGGGAEK